MSKAACLSAELKAFTMSTYALGGWKNNQPHLEQWSASRRVFETDDCAWAFDDVPSSFRDPE